MDKVKIYETAGEIEAKRGLRIIVENPPDYTFEAGKFAAALLVLLEKIDDIQARVKWIS